MPKHALIPRIAPLLAVLLALAMGSGAQAQMGPPGGRVAEIAGRSQRSGFLNDL